jgi:RimJ/RimL family protein N-acetyltransferase
MRLPEPTSRLVFRPMARADLPDMAALLGDPDVMRFYPRPRTLPEAAAWIDWTLSSYEQYGFGLWVLTSAESGEFVGDCGLTYQTFDAERELEVGYHVRSDLQGRGFASEAAVACVEFARDGLAAPRVTAIIHPANLASRRVAEKAGLAFERVSRTAEAVLYARSFSGAEPS